MTEQSYGQVVIYSISFTKRPLRLRLKRKLVLSSPWHFPIKLMKTRASDVRALVSGDNQVAFTAN